MAKRKTHKQFVEDLGGEIQPLEAYETSVKRMGFKCTECGGEWMSTPRRVLSGKGCPDCLAREEIKKPAHNNLVTESSVFPGALNIDVSTKKFPGEVMIIDQDDWNKIKGFGRVFAVEGKRTLYAKVKKYGETKLNYVHRLIFDPKDRLTDHRNGNGLDNRSSNLRSVTASQNGMNSRPSKNNPMKVKGVRWRGDRSSWESCIGVDRKWICLGLFKEKGDAIKARLKAEKKYHGDYAFRSKP